jgi:uncharacterized protein YjdB
MPAAMVSALFELHLKTINHRQHLILKQLILLISFIFCAWHLHAQKIALKTPNGSEVWAGYSIQRVEWTQSDNIDNIKIEISVDSNKTWKTLVSSYPVSATYFEFEVPGKPSDSCFIRITDVDDLSNFSTNYPNNPFKIAQPYLNIDVISGLLYTGNAQPVTWQSGGIKYVRLSLSYNGTTFFTVKDSLPATIGYYNLTVPNVSTDSAKFRIYGYGADITSTQEGEFKIRKPINASTKKFRGGSYDGHSAASNRIPVLNINNTVLPDSVNANGLLNVKWTIENVEKIHIQYSFDSGLVWKNIVTDYPAAASQYDMTVPDTSSKLHVRIISAEDTTRTSVSKKIFIRSKYLSLQVVNKNIQKNVPVELRWLGVGVSLIKLQYQTVNKTPVTIKTNVNGAQEVFIWQPLLTNDSIRFIITDINSVSLTDTSIWFLMKNLPANSVVKYHGGSYDGHAALSNRLPIVKVIQPNNVQWNGSFNYNIEWRTENIDKVNIDYSLDSGVTWKTITNGYPASSAKYEWKTPSSTTVKGFVRIRDANDSTITDMNDTAFAILGKSLSLVKDSLPIKKGQPYQITWKQSGVENIKLKYKTGLKSNWITVKDNVNALQEVFNWVIPNNVNDSVILGVNDIADANVADSFLLAKNIAALPVASAVKFHGGSFDGHSMRSSKNIILISKPAPNEIVNSGTSYKITWSTVNISDSITIQYSVDSGQTWTTITSQLATTGEYTWIVPNKLNAKIGFNFKQNGNGSVSSNLCLVRAIDIVSKEVVGMTPKPFTIIVPGAKFLNIINFTSVPLLRDNDLMQGKIIAVSTAKTKVHFFIKSGTAVMLNDTLKANAVEKITVGAYALGDSLYAPTDTVYREICVQPKAPQLSVVGNQILCLKDTLFVKSLGNYSRYKWSTGDTTFAITVKKGGAYQLQIFANDCWSPYSDSLIVKQDTAITPVISIIGDTTFCAGKSTQLISSAALNYQWLRNGFAVSNATAKTFTATSSGNYAVRTTTALGCSLVSSEKIIVVNALPVVNTILGSDMIALNDSAVYTNGTSGGIWNSSDNSVIAISTTGKAVGVKEGKAYIYYSVTNNGGCTSKDSVQVTVSAAASLVNITGKQTLCVGDTSSIIASVTGGVWNSSQPGIVSVNNGKITALAAGASVISYTVQISGFTVKRSLTVIVNPLPTVVKINASPDTAFCAGQSIVLSAGITDKIQWYKNTQLLSGDSTNNLIVSAEGTYSYILKNSFGCTATSSKQIIVMYPLPAVVKITGSSSVSLGDTIVLKGSHPGGVWISATPSVATVNNTGIVTGKSLGIVVIKYTVTNNFGCSVADSLTVVVKPLVSVAGSNALCAKDTIQLITNTSGGIWTSSDKLIADVSASGVVKAVSAGVVTISYQIIYQGIPVTATKQITVHALPKAKITGAGSVYLGDTTTLTGTDPGGTWSASSPSIASVSSKGLVTGNALGSGIIHYKLITAFGCSASDSVSILVKPVLVITGKQIMCVNDTVSLKASIAGGTWSSTNNNASVTSTGSVRGNNAGTAQISYSVLYAGSLITEKYTVTIDPIPAVPIITVSGVQLTSNVTAAQYTWYVNGVIDSAQTQTITAKRSGGYKLRVTNAQSCSSYSNTYPVLVTPTDALQFSPNPSKGHFKLQYIMDEPGLMQITIRSAAGKMVYQKLQQQGAGVYTEQINLSVAPGLYYIEMKLTKKEYTRTIMIM